MRMHNGERTLALLIPTKDRMESLKFYLEKRGEMFDRYNIDIVVYDSSNHNETLEYIENYVKMHDTVKIVYTPLHGASYIPVTTMLGLLFKTGNKGCEALAYSFLEIMNKIAEKKKEIVTITVLGDVSI